MMEAPSGYIDIVRGLQSQDSSVSMFVFRRTSASRPLLRLGFVPRPPVNRDDGFRSSDLPEQLPLLIDKLNDGNDLVSGWRQQRNDPLNHANRSKLYNSTTSFSLESSCTT